jgi:hypothetical protein
MKKLIAASAIVFLFSVPVISYGQPEQNEQEAPPISQVLVREGNFAVKLVEVLKLGTAKNEAEAESMLASAGITPKNGWIADYPLTPDIIGELRRAIGVVLDSGKLVMNKDEALKAVQILIDNQWRVSAAPGEEETREYGEYPPAAAGVQRAPGTAPPPLLPPPTPSPSGSATSPVPEVQVDVNAPPPEYAFPNPPEVAVIPGTYVYVVPGINVDILFYHGYWYRPYAGRWYFGLSYNGPWVYLDPVRIPRVLLELPPNYRSVPPRYPRIPYGYLRRNWERWERERYWHRNREWREGWRGY